MFRHVGWDCLNELILIVSNRGDCSNLFATGADYGSFKTEAQKDVREKKLLLVLLFF